MTNCPICGSDRTEVGDWAQNEDGDEVGVGTQCLGCGYHTRSDEDDEATIRGNPSRIDW
ncbi:MAG: hypothetical protein WKF80_10245 [Thermomicrobiales bacterium]